MSETTPPQNNTPLNQATMTANDGTTAIAEEPPFLEGEEWANALTHGVAALVSIGMAVYLIQAAMPQSVGLAIACAAYMAAVFGTFFCSSLSHTIRRQPLLNQLRAWDQAMIYAMISGTYTPIAYAYASDVTRTPLLWAIWIAAVAGFLQKVAWKHRVNSSGTISYLLLGWLPAIPLAPYVPTALVLAMFAGGILYTIGVAFLINDKKRKYLHACWHLAVISAAACHYYGILWYVVERP
ncbi:MAG: PAQR family membrane homeostasis protein TrhA [Rubripirellula sp.]|jgi:hemolysin III